MKIYHLFIFVLLIFFTSILNGQPTWERTFSKPDHNFQDYSIVVSKDGSNDLVLAGTLINQTTNQHLIHIIRIDEVTANIIFEKTFSTGSDSWAMSICSFSAAIGSGYGITGFTELLGIRYPIIITFDETGQVINNQIITTGTQNGIGLHIQATPSATDEGFVLVGLVHDAINTGLNATQRQSFCIKVNQSLNLEWEKYFDSPLGSIYPNDYDGASFVLPTDQGYFITGGKNILNILGQQRQGVLALMLDLNGNQLWDESFFLGNFIDNGASAYYDQNNQEIYVLFNHSAFHHLGIGVFDATSGTFNNTKSIQASSSDFSLDKYGHTLIKTPFTDNFLIYGRAYDPVKGQPAFLIDYNISTKQFGVHHSESNISSTLDQIPSIEDPFTTSALRSLHYPQSLVNIDANYSGYISYTGDLTESASLIVRKFEHLTEEEYNFCVQSDAILLDDTENISPTVGIDVNFNVLSSNFNNQSITETIEITAIDNFCFPKIEECLPCEINAVRNGDFQQGAFMNWSANDFTSPQEVTTDFCSDPISMQMWGNQDTGESIIQTGVNFQAGKKYSISFCGRFVPQTSTTTPYVMFGFTASNGSINPFNGTYNIGHTSSNSSDDNYISNNGWACYTLNDWTPTQNYSDLIINAYNDIPDAQGGASIVSWGRIDNICISSNDFGVAVQNIGFEYEADIFPNPTNENLHIKFSKSLSNDLEYRMVDLLGKTLKDGILRQGTITHQLQMNEFPVGLYMIEFGNRDLGFYREKIIKQAP